MFPSHDRGVKNLKGVDFAEKINKSFDEIEDEEKVKALFIELMKDNEVTIGENTFAKKDLTLDAIKSIKEHLSKTGKIKIKPPVRKSITKPVDPSIKISNLRFSRSTSKDRRAEYKKQNRNNKVISRYNEDIVYEIIKEYESLVGIPPHRS